MRKFEQLDSEITLAILLGRETVKITKADGPWYQIIATTSSNRRLMAEFTLPQCEGEVPKEVLNVESVEYCSGETSYKFVREWLQNHSIYLQHYIHATCMDESEVFASFLGRECS